MIREHALQLQIALIRSDKLSPSSFIQDCLRFEELTGPTSLGWPVSRYTTLSPELRVYFLVLARSILVLTGQNGTLDTIFKSRIDRLAHRLPGKHRFRDRLRDAFGIEKKADKKKNKDHKADKDPVPKPDYLDLIKTAAKQVSDPKTELAVFLAELRNNI